MHMSTREHANKLEERGESEDESMESRLSRAYPHTSDHVVRICPGMARDLSLIPGWREYSGLASSC